MLNKICNKIKNLIKNCTVISVNDSGNLRLATISFLGKTQKANVWSPYGLIYNPPLGSLGLSFNAQGQAGKNFIIADDPNNRIKNLKPGEVGLANYITGTYVILKENGDCDLQVNGNMNVVCSGEINAILGTCRVTIDTNGVNVQNGDVVADGISLKSHVHTNVEPGSGNSGGPI